MPEHDGSPSGLSAETQRLLNERPELWEYQLLGQLLIEEVATSPSKDGPPIGVRTLVPFPRFGDWLQSRMTAFQAILQDLERLLNADHQDKFGPPGIPGNPKAIVLFARRIGTSYRQLIEWKHSTRLVDTSLACGEVVYQLGRRADGLLDEIATYGPTLMEQAHQAAAQPAGSPRRIVAELIIGPDTLNLTPFNDALGRLTESIANGTLTSPLPGAGYLYVLQNPSMPNLLKIGKTSRSTRERITELSAVTSVPTPFVLAFEAYVADASKAEWLVHRELERVRSRVATNREFFDVDLKTAIELILKAQRIVAAQSR